MHLFGFCSFSCWLVKKEMMGMQAECATVGFKFSTTQNSSEFHRHISDMHAARSNLSSRCLFGQICHTLLFTRFVWAHDCCMNDSLFSIIFGTFPATFLRALFIAFNVLPITADCRARRIGALGTLWHLVLVQGEYFPTPQESCWIYTVL